MFHCYNVGFSNSKIISSYYILIAHQKIRIQAKIMQGFVVGQFFFLKGDQSTFIFTSLEFHFIAIYNEGCL